MRHRDLRQALEFPIAELGMLALQDALRCRPAQPLVRAVHLRQQRDVGGRVFGGEPLPPIDLRLHFPGPGMRSNQPRNLRQAQPGDLAQVGPDRAPLLLPLLLVLLVDQHLFDPDVYLRAALTAELDARAGFQKVVDL
jgi:hypothetical protein